MATIALYAGRINQVSGQVNGVKKAVGSLKTQLDTLKKKCEKVNAGVCNIDDVIRSISASTRTQEAKVEMLETLAEDIEQFVKDTAQIDENVADVIDTGKDNFYDQYSHVKPDCEKTMWEKFKKGMKKVGEWCKEHWAAIVTLVVAVVVVVAIVVVTVLTLGTATPVLLAAAIGAAVSLLGQFAGDTIKFVKKGLKEGVWKWPSGLADYIGAGIGGAVGGILTLVCGPVSVVPVVVDSMLSSLITNSLKDLTGEESRSIEMLWLDATVNGITAMVLGKLFGMFTDKGFKLLADKIPALSRLSGRGSYSASFQMVLTKLKNGTIKHFSNKTIFNGVVAGLSGDFLKNIADGIFNVDDNFGELIKPFVRMQMIPRPVAIREQLGYLVPLIPNVVIHRMTTFQVAPFLRELPTFRPLPLRVVPIAPQIPTIAIRMIRPLPGLNPLAIGK